jgi:hypothetical protein
VYLAAALAIGAIDRSDLSRLLHAVGLGRLSPRAADA